MVLAPSAAPNEKVLCCLSMLKKKIHLSDFFLWVEHFSWYSSTDWYFSLRNALFFLMRLCLHYVFSFLSFFFLPSLPLPSPLLCGPDWLFKDTNMKSRVGQGEILAIALNIPLVWWRPGLNLVVHIIQVCYFSDLANHISRELHQVIIWWGG